MTRLSAALGCVALLSTAAGSAHAASFLNLVDPMNPTFTQALGVNGSDVVVGYGNQTNFNGFQVTNSPRHPRSPAKTIRTRERVARRLSESTRPETPSGSLLTRQG